MLEPAGEGHRVLARHQRVRRRVQPVPRAGQQEAQRRRAPQRRHRGGFLRADAVHAAVAGFQRLGAVGMEGRPVSAEAPRAVHHGKVVGARVGAGEVEIDDAGDGVAERQHVVREQVGVDRRLRQVRRPVRRLPRHLAFDQRRQPRVDLAGARQAFRGKRHAPVVAERVLAPPREVRRRGVQLPERRARRMA